MKTDIEITAIEKKSAMFCTVRLAAMFVLGASLVCSAQTAVKKKAAVQPVRAVAAHPAAAQAAAVQAVKPSTSVHAPLGAGEKAVSNHAPFEAGDCSICHQNNDAANPGPVVKTATNELCMGCHDDFKQTLARKYPHPPSQKDCLGCHNPHNSTQAKLLVEDAGTLCTKCHQQIKMAGLHSKVKHDALTQGDKCMNCHNPHGTNVEHLLVKMPMQLCLGCHNENKVADHAGKSLADMKSLLAKNTSHHGPIAGEDCGACHKTHGGDNFRLLSNEYPAAFYAPYDAKNYALCFGCHEEKVFTEPKTEELTQFRDGSRNLHYLHVNKSDMGRTCRACHEVHASTQDHHIRESVPYGSKGWPLKINFAKTATGGSCTRTCHSMKTYNNTSTKTATAK